jgi:hypothetical protein
MATAKRELAIAALATRLGAVRNPYPQDYDDAIITALIEGEEVVSARDYDDVVITASLTVEKIDRYDEDAERTTAANVLLASLISTALGSDPTLGGTAENLQYTGGATLFSETGSALVGAVARFDLTYRHVAGSPY